MTLTKPSIRPCIPSSLVVNVFTLAVLTSTSLSISSLSLIIESTKLIEGNSSPGLVFNFLHKLGNCPIILVKSNLVSPV
jgi:hypothetical protein